MSRTLSMNWGTGDSLKSSTKCGLRPNARQIRLTADWVIPVALAIERVDQWVASVGVSSSLDDHALDVLVADRAGLARPGLVMQAIPPALNEAVPPLADVDG
jgi:hypothetical protein